MAGFFERLSSEEDGATMLEYALLIGMISAALVTAVTTLASAIGVGMTSASSALGGS